MKKVNQKKEQKTNMKEMKERHDKLLKDYWEPNSGEIIPIMGTKSVFR